VVSDEVIRPFFVGLGSALSRGDPAGAAACFAVPSLIPTDEGATLFTDQPQIEEMFAGAVEQYRARGITATSPIIERIQEFTERLIGVDVRWPYVDDRGNPGGDEVSSYVVWIDERGSPRIRVALSMARAESPRPVSRSQQAAQESGVHECRSRVRRREDGLCRSTGRPR
jgi:hypothetical protein